MPQITPHLRLFIILWLELATINMYRLMYHTSTASKVTTLRCERNA